MIPRIQITLRYLTSTLIIAALVLPASGHLGIAYAATINTNTVAQTKTPSLVETRAPMPAEAAATDHASSPSATTPISETYGLGQAQADTATAAAVSATQAVFASTTTVELRAGERTAQLGNLPLQIEQTAEIAAQPRAVQFQGVEPALAAQLSPTGIAFQLGSGNLADAGAATLQIQQPLTLTLDYSQLSFPFGADYTHRLALYRLSGCGTQSLPGDNGELVAVYTCVNSEPLPAVNDIDNQRLSVALAPSPSLLITSTKPITESQAPGIPIWSPPITNTYPYSDTFAEVSQAGPEKLYLPIVSSPTSDKVYYVIASTTSSGGGDYSATPHSVISDFQTDMFTGNFATSYPIPVPPSVAGPVPGVALNYNSGNVWGMGDNTNGQAGQEGMGWELEPGSISVFTTLGLFGPNDWSLVVPFNLPTFFISLNGVRSKLINVSGGNFRLESDPNWKVERLSSTEAGHPDYGTKYYWLVTTPDGTKYRFGGEMVPTSEAAPGANRDLNSVAYVPIKNINYPNSTAYKWYLDRVEDVHGNVIYYSYGQEINFFELYGSTSARYKYVRATHLRYIEYTKRAGQTSQAPARILFNMELRCTNPESSSCTTSANLPDAPQDFGCSIVTGVNCLYTKPIFWSDLRLDSIQTQVYDESISTWRTAGLYDLSYTFPTPPGSGTPKKLWLNKITQHAGGDYNRKAFGQIESENYDELSGLLEEDTLAYASRSIEMGASKFAYTTSNSGYLRYRNVDFGSGSNQVFARYYVSSYASKFDVAIELRLDSLTGTKIGDIITGDLLYLKTNAFPITNASGVHDLYVIFKHNGTHFNWLRFLPTNTQPAGLPAAEYTSTMLQGPVAAGYYVPVISQAKTELGGTVNVAYTQTHPCTVNFTTVRPPYDCFRETWSTQHRTWKVTSLTKSDPLNVSATETYTYTYSTPMWRYFPDPILYPITWTCWDIYPNCPKRQWNDFRGHAIVTETDAQGNKTEYRYYQGMDGDQLNVNGGTYSANITLSDSSTRVDANWLRGKVAEMRQFDASGNVLIRNVYWYTDTVTAGSGTSTARIVSLQAQEQTVYGPTPKTTRTEYDYDSYGNLLRQRNLGDTSTTSDDRTLERSYVYNTTAHILNTPQWEKLWAGSTPGSAGQEQSYTAYAYDSQAIGDAPTQGNLTLVRSYWQTTPSTGYADTETGYDSLGRVVSVTDANNHTTATDYEVFYGYPMTVTNALNHVTVTEQDPARGVVTKVTDANGKITEVEYDAYGRLVKVWLPTEPRSGPASLEYTYAPETRPAYIKTRQLTDAGTSTYLESWEYADGFGRTIQTQRPSINSGQRVVTSQQYNNVGQLGQSSIAYETSGVAGSGYVTPTWSALDGVTRLTYDALGRQTQSELLNAGSVIQNTQTDYAVWAQQTYDANGHRRDYEYDAFGQLARVYEYNVVASNPVTYTTDYDYDLQGNLTQVTDPASNVTSITYDLLGRKMGMDDPDMGTWQYQYDAAGNLTAQQDGRGLWLYLSYDNLNRLTAKRRDSSSGPLASEYTYDVTDLGQLYATKAYASNGISVTVETQVPDRDDRYRATQNRWIVAGQGTFRLATTYDAADRATQLQYPGGNNDSLGEIVQRSYNSVGQLDQVMSLMDGTPFISSTTYLPNGQIASQRFDQSSYGLLREYTYETGTLRLHTQRASSTILPGSYNLQELTYTYDDVGNITRILDDANSGQLQCFGYDQLDQLTRAFTGNGDCSAYAAGGTGAYDHAYAYDATGNITSFAGESYAYTGAQPHAVTAAFSNTYGYDDSGNQTTRIITSTAYTLTYDYENRLTAVYEGIAVVGAFVYDVSGQRVVGTVNGETVVYIAGVYEYHEGGATISYYDGNAGTIAMRRIGHADDNGIFYIVGDHLGSSSAIVNQDGTPSAYQYYYPFGGNRGDLFSPLTTKRYTAQYHEEGLPGGEGLSYYGARWYDAQVGRFLIPDSIVPDSKKPGTLNRYAYVLNNPLRYKDPTGHILDDVTSPVMLMVADPVGNGMYKPKLSESDLEIVKSASKDFGVDWRLSAYVLESEMTLDTDYKDHLETWATLMYPGLVALHPDPGPGIGNIHLSTARRVSSYFDTDYFQKFPIPPYHLMNKVGALWQLAHTKQSIYTATAVVRQLSDYRYGSDGKPYQASHQYTSWTSADAAAIWHGYRYGVQTVSYRGTGITLNNFQRRDYNLSKMHAQGVFMGPNATESVKGSYRIYLYYKNLK